MKKVGALLLLLVAVASTALGEKFLSVSDIHFNPFADPAIVAKLETADVAPNGAFLAGFRDVWRPIVDSRSFTRRFPTGGYYHADVPGLENVRIIALNTNFFSTKYKNPCGTPGPDPGLRQLQWLEAELLL